jgi:hypothetical protein
MPRHLHPDKSTRPPSSNPEKSILSIGDLEKSMPAKVTRMSLLARRHSFHFSFALLGKVEKEVLVVYWFFAGMLIPRFIFVGHAWRPIIRFPENRFA